MVPRDVLSAQERQSSHEHGKEWTRHVLSVGGSKHSGGSVAIEGGRSVRNDAVKCDLISEKQCNYVSASLHGSPPLAHPSPSSSKATMRPSPPYAPSPHSQSTTGRDSYESLRNGMAGDYLHLKPSHPCYHTHGPNATHTHGGRTTYTDRNKLGNSLLTTNPLVRSLPFSHVSSGRPAVCSQRPPGGRHMKPIAAGHALGV